MTFTIESKCFICKKIFHVLEGTDAFQQVKKNSQGMYCCEDCKQMLELEAKLTLGKRLLSGGE